MNVKLIKSCKFNIDTTSVELKYLDCAMIAFLKTHTGVLS